MSIFECEPPGAGAKVGEFLVGFDRGQPIFVEVKSPGWEDEIAKTEGQASPRLQQPKYISGDGRATAPWMSVRHAVTKAYSKMPDTMPTLLVIKGPLSLDELEPCFVLIGPGVARGELVGAHPLGALHDVMEQPVTDRVDDHVPIIPGHGLPTRRGAGGRPTDYEPGRLGH